MSIPRKLARKRSHLAAFAIGEDGGDAVFCVVRDLTVAGARLGPTEFLPDRFDLQIAGRERIWRAQVSWRSSTGIGVRFLGQTRHRIPADGPPAGGGTATPHPPSP